MLLYFRSLWKPRKVHPLKPVLDTLMAIADDLKAALLIVSAQIDAEVAAVAAATAVATAANDANALALTAALAEVQALSAKLPPLPVAPVVAAV